MNGNTLFREGKGSAALGALFLLPALLIVVPGLLFSFFGLSGIYENLEHFPTWTAIMSWADRPWIVLGGLATGLLINLLAVARVKFEVLEDSLRGTVLVKRNRWNLVLLGLAVFLALALLLYLIGENLGQLL